MKERELALIKSLGDMTKMAYWYNSKDKHCGADMSQDCVSCRHYNFCLESNHFDHIHKQLK